MGTQLHPLLDAIEVKYGPRLELGRSFLTIAETSRHLGISWYMTHGFDRLIEVNERYQQTWGHIPPMSDPRISDIEDGNAVYIEGQHDGEPVATLALRRFDWSGTSFKEEWESGRFAYRNPTAMMNPGERWVAGAPVAARITGRVAYSGGVWCRRDFRGKRLPTLIVAFMRSVPLALWNADFSIGIIEVGALPRTLLPLYGNPHAEAGMRIIGAWRTVDCIVSWEDRDELVDRILGEPLTAANQPDHGYGRDEAVRRASTPR